MQLSGTSFAAPVVAGAAAMLLGQHPSWTPDQVKGALMLTATPEPKVKLGQLGVGDVNVASARRLNVWKHPEPECGARPVRRRGSGRNGGLQRGSLGLLQPTQRSMGRRSVERCCLDRRSLVFGCLGQRGMVGRSMGLCGLGLGGLERRGLERRGVV